MVRRVLRSGSEAVPALERPQKAEPHQDEIRRLYRSCQGNLARVHEELEASGVDLSYPALTAFCRSHGIGPHRKKPVGEYHFEPGQEMQHDTSPHVLCLAGQRRRAQTASLVLCFSRRLFFQFSPTFTRFDCKVFLTDAFQYMAGVCQVCLIDNTHVVVLKGSGREMVPVPEMAAFADRYGFRFQAHEKGDANRSARVERRFWFIENNFLAGRSFADWDDANRQAREWCDRVNAQFRRHLQASSQQLLAIEAAHLKALPLWVPPVYLLHHRLVDVEGYVAVDSNRYSVPDEFIGQSVEVRQSQETIEIFRGPRRLALHRRVWEPTRRKYRLPEHRRPRGQGPQAGEATPQEKYLLAALPEIASYLQALKKRSAGRGTVALRRLVRLVQDYPRPALLDALQRARQYGLYDLERVEAMILRQLAREYFRIPENDDDE